MLTSEYLFYTLGDSPAPVGFSLRDKISEKQGGSGDGIEIRRDDVPKPTESVILAHEKSKVVADNEKADSEETGKLAAKMESSFDSKNENEKKSDREERPDPGDKIKVRICYWIYVKVFVVIFTERLTTKYFDSRIDLS